jgi:leader peptidase (prepilin peptidase)/N-methyltransferase
MEPGQDVYCRFRPEFGKNNREAPTLFTSTLLISIFVALFGLTFGSFLNVCISRLPRHKSIVRPASRCPRCGSAIPAMDNIPLLSWLLLRGHCRNCGGKITWRYPAVEMATACLFLLSWLRLGLTLEGIGADILCFLLLGLTVMDAETMRLPDAFTLPGIALGIVFAGAKPATSDSARLLHAGEAAGWAVIAGAIILAIRGIYFLVRRREGMGLGDAKLLALIAAWLGPELGGTALFLGVVSAAVYGLISGAVSQTPDVRSRKLRNARLPLGAFLSASAIYVIFEGEKTLNWYMRFFR